MAKVCKVKSGLSRFDTSQKACAHRDVKNPHRLSNLSETRPLRSEPGHLLKADDSKDAPEAEASELSYSSDPDELRALAGRKDSIATSLEQLDELSAGFVKASALADRLRERSSELEQEAVQNEPPEPDYDHEAGVRSRDEAVIFDIGKLFSEL